MQALTGLPSGPAIVLCLCVGVRLAQEVVARAPIRVAYLGVDGSGYIVPVDVLSCVLAISGSGLSMGFFWTPFTYIFLHGSVSHLVLNMIGLLAFGPQLQRVFGRGAFWFVFLLGGAIGGIGWALCNGFSSLVPCVGASGAVLALAGAYGSFSLSSRKRPIWPTSSASPGASVPDSGCAAAPRTPRFSHEASFWLFSGPRHRPVDRLDGTGFRRRPP